MDDRSPLQRFYRPALTATMVVWLAWAIYHLTINPITHGTFEKGVLRVVVFASTTLILAWGFSLDKSREEEAR